MKKGLAVILLFAVCCVLTLQLTGQMRERPITVKLGYPTDAGVLKMVAGEHRYLVAEMVVLKVLFYFGGLVDQWKQQIALPPEYFNMFKSLETAVKLDPYNADAYYFAQGVFTWDVGRAREVNQMLDYGMRYRTRDAMLPFFAGFNSGYFLKDFEKAATYMQRAAEISGNPGMAKLASRYYFEADRVDAGVRFLDQMIQSAPTSREAEQYQLRKQALLAVQQLRKALKAYQAQTGKLPEDLSELVEDGFLPALPEDPYGGQFQLDKLGKITSTSHFSGLPEGEDPREENEPASH